MYSFEYDDNKSQTNQQKHGIDFIEAQQLWQDDDLLEIQATSELPLWMIRQLEAEAQKQGISPQTFLENYLAENLAPVS